MSAWNQHGASAIDPVWLDDDTLIGKWDQSNQYGPQCFIRIFHLSKNAKPPQDTKSEEKPKDPMSKFIGDLINDVINMFVFFILSVLTFTGNFGRIVTTKLGWADNFD